MRYFENPSINIAKYDIEDIIATSGDPVGGEDETDRM